MSSPESDDWILIFDTIHQVIKAEKALKKEGFEIQLVPTPREFSSDCGMAVEVREEELDQIEKLLKNSGVKLKGIYPRPRSSRRNL